MLRLPLKIVKLPEAYGVVDAGGLRLAYFYFENEPSRRNTMNRLDEAEALRLAKLLARAETDRIEAEGRG